MMNFQKYTAMGVLSDDPKKYDFASGSSKTPFTVLITSTFQKRDGTQGESRHYQSCECWNKTAEQMAQYREGDTIYVEGELENQSWDDKTTGQKRYKTVLKVMKFVVEPKAGRTSGPDAAPAPAASSQPSQQVWDTAPEVDPQDVPF
jgi:single-strand DNA-binding protein